LKLAWRLLPDFFGNAAFFAGANSVRERMLLFGWSRNFGSSRAMQQTRL
jgi:hypothetical protein